MFECVKAGFARPFGMDATDAFHTLAVGYGPRLAAARAALGKKQKELAEELHASPQKWSHWENERHPPDFFHMLALKQRYGISLDWVYSGDWRSLPGHILQSLLNQANQPEAPPPLMLFRASFLSGTPGYAPLALNEPAAAFREDQAAPPTAPRSMRRRA